MSKKIALISSLAGLVIIFIVSFIILQQNHKPDKVVHRFEEAVKKKDTAVLKEMIVADDKKAVVDKGTLTAMVHYLNANQNSFQVIKDGLTKQIDDNNYSNQNEQISLIRDGKEMLFFPVYKLRAKTVKLKVSGQNDEDEIALNAKELEQSLAKSKDKELYGPLLPGEYNMDVSVKNQLGIFKQTAKKDVWGNPEITILVDSEKLVRDNDRVKKEIMQSTITFNQDLSKFTTSGLNAEEFSVGTTNFKKEFTGSEDYFRMIQTEIDEMTSQYLQTVINQEDMDISYFDGKWTAEVEAVVAYNEKVKIKGTKKFQDASYHALRTYEIVFDKEKKKWLINSIKDEETDDSEPDYWKNKQEVKENNPPVRTWSKKGKSI